VQGLRYEELVAVDSVRFRQDFSVVTPESIQQTADLFKLCRTRENPETGHDEVECQERSIDSVMDDLHFSDEDREYVRQLVESLSVHDPSEGEGFVFTPVGAYTWPVDGFYGITSPFGARMDPVTGEEGFHTGVDVAAPMYTPVRAVATGTVKFVGWSGNYGQRVFLDNGGFMTQYAHLSVIKVKKGDVVAAGEVIGMVGSTGKSTGPHLHLEWWSGGIPLDPLIAFR
jgi:murein DD-endopeptidase MepM/ murein hydrolase activator NlpD